MFCELIYNRYRPRVHFHVNIRKKNEDLKELFAFFDLIFFLINLLALCPVDGSYRWTS